MWREKSFITGKLISAQWDNWKKFRFNKDKLINSDVGTLRRIAGRDRNMKFFDKWVKNIKFGFIGCGLIQIKEQNL